MPPAIKGLRGPGLVLLSALAFALSFPSSLFPRGEGLFAFVFFLPALRALRGASLRRAGLYGILFAFAGFGLMNGWIVNYDPLAPLIVLPASSVFYALLFIALRIAETRLSSWSWLAGAFAWVGMEYLRSRGILGYPYGILGYSQYAFRPLAQGAALAGVFWISFLVIAPQLFLGGLLAAREGLEGIGPSRDFAQRRIQGLALLGVLGVAVLLGSIAASRPPETRGKKLRIGLVQPNLPTDQKNPAAFSHALEVLRAESDALIADGAELVLWPETAFVPSILWHEKKRLDRELYELVREAREYMASSGTAFLIGNNQGEERFGPGGAYRVDFNAALSIPRGGGSPLVYRKTQLLPFSEFFPFEKAFPRLSLILERRMGGFWERGPGPAALPVAGTEAGVPICYEDGFGELVRAMIGPGTGLLLPLVNDAWSRSEAAERQHLAMSVFRAVETGRPVARCTNSGITALIDGRGRVLAELPPFAQGGLLVELELAEGVKTPYLGFGDAFGRVCLGAALGALLAAALSSRALRSRGGRWR